MPRDNGKAPKDDPVKGASTNARPLSPHLNLWEQQPNESEPAYEAFLVYRNMEPQERSLRLVAEELGKAEQLMFRWSAEWSWRLRVHEWDREEQRQRDEAHWDEIREMSRRQARQAMEMQVALAAPAQALVKKLGEDDELLARMMDEDAMGVQGLIQLMGMVVTGARVLPNLAEMERLVRGAGELSDAGRDGHADRGSGRDEVMQMLQDGEARELAQRLFNRVHGAVHRGAIPARSSASEEGDSEDGSG